MECLKTGMGTFPTKFRPLEMEPRKPLIFLVGKKECIMYLRIACISISTMLGT